MKFEVKYVFFDFDSICIKSVEKFVKSFETGLNKFASNTQITRVIENVDSKKYSVKITLQKHIALNTLCNILNNVQKNLRVLCSSINYEYDVCRAKINVKMF